MRVWSWERSDGSFLPGGRIRGCCRKDRIGREVGISVADIRYARFRPDRNFEGGTTVKLAGAEIAVLNDLHRRIVVARQLALFHEEQLADLGIADDVYALGDAYLAETDEDLTESGAKRLELEAVAQAYAHAHLQGESICYVNDLARLQGGFDLVSLSQSGHHLIVTEVKGTANQLNASWYRRLGRTRHKGLQLSHRWIWASFLETGLFSASAGFFLRSLRVMIAAAYVRRLIVVEAGTTAAPQVVDESELATRPELALAPDLGRVRCELGSIDALWPDLVPNTTNASPLAFQAE